MLGDEGVGLHRLQVWIIRDYGESTDSLKIKILTKFTIIYKE
jgi:hypothetical protein